LSFLSAIPACHALVDQLSGGGENIGLLFPIIRLDALKSFIRAFDIAFIFALWPIGWNIVDLIRRIRIQMKDV
jgi:hypothetical protein